MKALIVDDNMMNLKVAKIMIEREGLEVDTCLSGYECLDILDKNTYDIIFMDIMMPEMDGVETFDKIREKGIKTPVVTLTADEAEGAKEKYLNLGFYDYMAKPINRELLHEIITKLKNK